MSSIKLSIIVPVYNVAPYLRKCVDSLFAQDLPKDEYEIILVDDGSTDGSGAICDELAEQAKDQIHILHQKNQGVSAARNNGVAIAQGQYVAFLDADDWWTTDHAHKMLELAAQYPDAGLYACRYWYVKYGKNEDRIRNLVFENTHTQSSVSDSSIDQSVSVATGYLNYFRSYYLGAAMPICTDCAMMPKVVFDKMDGFPLGVRLGEDFLLWAKTALHYPVAYRDECLAYYNNDVLAHFRSSKRLYKPNQTMWFIMDGLLEDDTIRYPKYVPWIRKVIDKERVNGLMPYYLDDQYREQALLELSKVDWAQHSKRTYNLYYRTPIEYIKFRQMCRELMSVVKQNIIFTRMNIRKIQQQLMRHSWAVGFVQNGWNGVFSNKPQYVWIKNPYKDRWFADPFVLDVTDEYIYLLVEEMRYDIPNGRIAKLSINRQTMTIEKMDVLLEEATHLSFPNILRKDGRVYVYPENHDSGELNLYEYDQIKEQLLRVKTLCCQPLTDAVVTDVFGTKQIFSTQMPDPNGKQLNVYEADEAGEFVLSRIYDFADNHARMAGQFFTHNGKIYRPAQDCNKVYGGAIVIEEVAQDQEGLTFCPIKTLRSKHPILRTGMHTLNEYKGVVVIDVHGYSYWLGRVVEKCVQCKKFLKSIIK